MSSAQESVQESRRHAATPPRPALKQPWRRIPQTYLVFSMPGCAEGMITACLYPHMLTPHTAQLVRYVAYRFELPERRANVRGGLVILARLRSRGCLVVVALCDMCYLNDIGLRI